MIECKRLWQLLCDGAAALSIFIEQHGARQRGKQLSGPVSVGRVQAAGAVSMAAPAAKPPNLPSYGPPTFSMCQKQALLFHLYSTSGEGRNVFKSTPNCSKSTKYVVQLLPGCYTGSARLAMSSNFTALLLNRYDAEAKAALRYSEAQRMRHLRGFFNGWHGLCRPYDERSVYSADGYSTWPARMQPRYL